MTHLQWILRDGEKVLQYRSVGVSTFHSDSGVIGDSHFSYDTGWVDVPFYEPALIEDKNEESETDFVNGLSEEERQEVSSLTEAFRKSLEERHTTGRYPKALCMDLACKEAKRKTLWPENEYRKEQHGTV